MFKLIRRNTSGGSLDFAERMIGITLTHREDIIPNQVVLRKESDINGSYGLGVEAVSEELDHLAIFATFVVLIDLGYEEQSLFKSLGKVLKNLYEPSGSEQKSLEEVTLKFFKRVELYLRMDTDKKIAGSFLKEVAGFPNSLVKDPGHYMSPVVGRLKRKIRDNIREEYSVA